MSTGPRKPRINTLPYFFLIFLIFSKLIFAKNQLFLTKNIFFWESFHLNLDDIVL